MYKVKKTLNNNVVVATNTNNEEVILVGRALGFDYKKDMNISEDRVENIFTKQKQDVALNYEKVLSSIDNRIVGISEEIISMCEKELNIKLNNSIHISLPDHINFALTRYNSGMNIENPFLIDLKILFPKEYELSKTAVNMINNCLKVDFPEDEIASICLHIRAALNNENVSSSLSYTRKISEVMDLITKLLNKKLDKNSFEYIRTVTHLNFMYERVKNKKPIKNPLLDSIKKELFTEYNIAMKIALKFQSVFNVSVPEDEIGFIAMHLKRLSEI